MYRYDNRSCTANGRERMAAESHLLEKIFGGVAIAVLSSLIIYFVIPNETGDDRSGEYEYQIYQDSSGSISLSYPSILGQIRLDRGENLDLIFFPQKDQNQRRNFIDDYIGISIGIDPDESALNVLLNLAVDLVNPTASANISQLRMVLISVDTLREVMDKSLVKDGEAETDDFKNMELCGDRTDRSLELVNSIKLESERHYIFCEYRSKNLIFDGYIFDLVEFGDGGLVLVRGYFSDETRKFIGGNILSWYNERIKIDMHNFLENY